MGCKHAVRTACSVESSSDDRQLTKRQREFELGRKTAHQLLNSWKEYTTVAVAQDRSPIWPSGFCGSISHSDHWCWVAVASHKKITSIGLDTETITDCQTAEQLKSQIGSEPEWELLEELELGPELTFTLLFSAKEAFYKCWYPTNQQYFDFRDAELIAVDSNRLSIASGPNNPNYSNSPQSLAIQFFATERDVFTATWM